MSDDRNRVAKQTHDNAMAKAEQAELHGRRGEIGLAIESWARAAEWEACAARLCDMEPSRSILFRSAAWLAVRARRYEEAIGLCVAGDRPETPSGIRSEMAAARAYAEAVLAKIKSLDEAEVLKEQASWGIAPGQRPPHPENIEAKGGAS